MAYVHFDSSYAPCGFLISRSDDPTADLPNDPTDTILIQTDWECPSVAGAMGWNPEPDEIGVPCNRRASMRISEAYDYIREHAWEVFPALDDYFSNGD